MIDGRVLIITSIIITCFSSFFLYVMEKEVQSWDDVSFGKTTENDCFENQVSASSTAEVDLSEFIVIKEGKSPSCSFLLSYNDNIRNDCLYLEYLDYLKKHLCVKKTVVELCKKLNDLIYVQNLNLFLHNDNINIDDVIFILDHTSHLKDLKRLFLGFSMNNLSNELFRYIVKYLNNSNSFESLNELELFISGNKKVTYVAILEMIKMLLFIRLKKTKHVTISAKGIENGLSSLTKNILDYLKTFSNISFFRIDNDSNSIIFSNGFLKVTLEHSIINLLESKLVNSFIPNKNDNYFRNSLFFGKYKKCLLKNLLIRAKKSGSRYGYSFLNDIKKIAIKSYKLS
jgi:hypothetical protein